MNKTKICSIATRSEMVRAFMLGPLHYLSENGYDCYCLCAPEPPLTASELGAAHYIPFNIHWGFTSPFRAIKEIYYLYRIFKREKFDIIQYAATNASIVAAIAGFLARVPVRINLQWGISYPIFHGRVRFIKKAVTKIICVLSTSNQPDSKSNLNFMIKEGLCNEGNSCVIHHGSACGVDLSRFNIQHKESWRREIFNMYGISPEEKTIGFVGRLVKEKGINELLEAFLDANYNDCKLLLVGPIYEDNRIREDLMKRAHNNSNIIFTGPTKTPEKFFAAFDFMLLPSYQEGFGMTTLEAAALGVPAIVTNIKGPTDVIEDGINGFICEVKSVSSLRDTIQKAVSMGKEEYREMSQMAYEIVKQKYNSDDFKVKFLENRNMLINTARNNK